MATTKRQRAARIGPEYHGPWPDRLILLDRGRDVGTAVRSKGHGMYSNLKWMIPVREAHYMVALGEAMWLP